MEEPTCEMCGGTPCVWPERYEAARHPDESALRDAAIWDAITESENTNDAVRKVVQYLGEAGFVMIVSPR